MPPIMLLCFLLLTLTGAVNVRSFNSQIETYSFSYSSSNINSIVTLTVVYQTTKTNNLYQYAISVQQLVQNYNQGIYSLLSAPYSLTTSQMSVNLSTTQVNSIASIGLRYLIAQSSFSYITTAHLIYSNSGLQLVSGSPVVQSVSLSSAMNTSSVVMSFINGWGVLQSTTNQFSIFAKPSMADSVTVNVQISSSLTTYYTLYTLSVDILVYDIVAFKAAYNTQFFDSGSGNSASSASLYSFAFNIMETAYFVGYYALTVNNPNQQAIQFSLIYSAATVNLNINNGSNGNNGNGNGGSTSISLNVFANYIQLQSQAICSTPDVWNQASNQCIGCSTGTYYNGSTQTCSSCSSAMQYCIVCNNSSNCNTCGYSLVFTGGACVPNCNYPQCNSCSFSIPTGIVCTNCSTGYGVSAQIPTQCITICGDGIVVNGVQQCDDGNTISGDGCSSSCVIQQFFICSNTTNSPSLCLLTEMNITVLCMIKTQDSNSFILVLQLAPKQLSFYPSVDWSAGIQPNPLFTIASYSYNSQDDKLRLTFSYNSTIQDLNNMFTLSLTQISSHFSDLTDEIIVLPQNTQNNQALQYFSQSFYQAARAVRYFGYTIAALSIILFSVGYFGYKLISIECIAVVQLTAMLVFSLKNTNPVSAALQSLSVSMGLTCLPNEYKYQVSQMPPHMKLLILSNNIFDCQNIFFVFLLFPSVVSFVLKLLSVYKYKDRPIMKNAWKNALGTFTFYAILLLAYGQVSYFVGNAKYFQSEPNSYITLVVTLLFITLMVAYFIGFIKYPRWFGSFKNKFQKFNVAQYFYLLSTAERILTPVLIVGVSPFKYASLIVFPIFVGEAVFLGYKKPYLLQTWKRPLANKIISALICLLFTIPATLQNQSQAQIIIALLIEIILLTVVGYSVFFIIKQLPQKIEEIKLKMSDNDTVMELKDCQKKQLQDFAEKMLPQQYLQAEEVEIIGNFAQNSKFKGYWQEYYCQLYTGGILQNVLNTSRIINQRLATPNQQSFEMKEMNKTKNINQKIQ